MLLTRSRRSYACESNISNASKRQFFNIQLKGISSPCSIETDEMHEHVLEVQKIISVNTGMKGKADIQMDDNYPCKV